MPFSPRDLQKRGLVTSTSRRDQRDAPFGDLLYLVAESVAEAQAKLDRNTAEVLQTLAEADVEVPTRVAREVGEDGTVTTTTTSEPRSLLELGFTPTSYQFSEATIGLELDLTVTEETETEREEEGRAYGLRAGTYELTEERRYGRELQATASVEARLEPVPTPLELGPSESVGPAEADDGTGDDADAE